MSYNLFEVLHNYGWKKALGYTVLTSLASILGYVITTEYDIRRNDIRSPAVIVGNIEHPPGEVFVELDNGAEKTNASANNGFFRFENVLPGMHLVAYSYDDHYPCEVELDISGGKEHRLLFGSLTPISEPGPQDCRAEPMLSLALYSDRGEEANMPEEQRALLVSALDPSRKILEGWIQIADMEEDYSYINLSSSSFNGTERLEAGDTLIATDPQILRQQAPFLASGDGRAFLHSVSYNLGQPIGAMGADETYIVEEVTELREGPVWARVRRVQEEDGVH